MGVANPHMVVRENLSKSEASNHWHSYPPEQEQEGLWLIFQLTELLFLVLIPTKIMSLGYAI